MRLRPIRLASLFAAAALLALAGAVRADGLEEKFEKTYDLAGITKVRLENVNGPVRVESAEPAVLRLVATKRAHGSGADDALKETEIHVAKNGTVLEIETLLPKRGRLFGFFFFNRGRGAEVSYELTMPPSMAAEIETVNGRVSAIHRAAQTTLSTVNGSIRVEGQEAPLKVNTVNGSVEILFTGPSRAADVETVNGSVEVTAGKESSFRYELQTVNGAIRSEFGALAIEKKFGPKEARGEVNGGRERLSIETVNGEIRIRNGDLVAGR